MILPGYADTFPDEVDVAALAVDGWHLAERPGFWAAHWREQFIEIAGLEGHQRGPGLSWPELVAVAGRQPDRVRRAQTLLLLAPAFGDEAADTPDAVSVLSDAMRTLGATGDTAKLATLAVSDEVVFWGHVPWVAGVPDMDYAPRNPASPFALSVAERQLVTELLAS
ncbi:hypothetical protein AB0J72_26270 [Dactylosporangium sp. NPDC049742]|uniref:hypothetical protein n=1 Tax=Dactylosporangium sp. NPDC049742 TaxID=3154737 RepID=UPI00344221FA